MNKIIHLIPATILSVAFVGSVAGAQALPDCHSIVVTNTGPDSNNQGICNVVRDVHVVCDNSIYVLNDNDQDAVTGKAKVIGNVTSGTAITGDAKNANDTTVKIGAACVVPTVATHEGSSAGPGMGAAGATQPPTGGKGAFSLPVTASNSLAPLFLASAAAGAGAGLLARFAAALYRRFLMTR